MSVSCECRVLPGRGLCIWLIKRSRGVLPSVVCLSVIVKPRQGSGTGPLVLMDQRRGGDGDGEGGLLVDFSN